MNNEGNLVHNRIRLDRLLFRVSSCDGESRSLFFDVLIFKDRKGFVIWQPNMALVFIYNFFLSKTNSNFSMQIFSKSLDNPIHQQT